MKVSSSEIQEIEESRSRVAFNFTTEFNDQDLIIDSIVIEDPPKELSIRMHLNDDIEMKRSFLIQKPWSYFVSFFRNSITGYFGSLIFFSNKQILTINDPALCYVPLPNITYRALEYIGIGICFGPGTGFFDPLQKTIRLHEVFWGRPFTADIHMNQGVRPPWMPKKRSWQEKLSEWERRTRTKQKLTWNKTKKFSSLKQAVSAFARESDLID